MYIYELTPGQKITLIVNGPQQSLEFNTTIDKVYPKNKIVLALPIYVEDKLLSFRGSHLIIDLVVYSEEEHPQLFKNITVNLVKTDENTVCYSLYTILESKTYNRRGAFRCQVGIPTTVQCGIHRMAYDAIVKDISVSGFSFICSNNIELKKNQVVHIVMNDYIEETAENYSFHLYGMIVRSYDLDNSRTVYGCRLNNPIAGLEKYIMTKERVRLKNTHGG